MPIKISRKLKKIFTRICVHILKLCEVFNWWCWSYSALYWILLELNTFSHIHLLLGLSFVLFLLFNWVHLFVSFFFSIYKSQAICQLRMYWTLQSPIGLAVLHIACAIHKCIYNNVYINHSLENVIHPSPHQYISGLH